LAKQFYLIVVTETKPKEIDMSNIEAAKIAIEAKIKAHYDKAPDSWSPEFELWAEEMDELTQEQRYLERGNDDDDEDYQSCSNDEYFGSNDD
jgi:hypothetical protein